MRSKLNVLRSAILIVVAVTVLGACERVRPIYEVQSKAVPTTGTPLTLSQIETGIVKAGAGSGWVMKPVKPGLVRGTFRRGQAIAVVRVEYDTDTYSILYESSHRLSEGIGSFETRYEGQKVIHKRYNKVVKQLNRRIENQLLSVGY